MVYPFKKNVVTVSKSPEKPNGDLPRTLIRRLSDRVTLLGQARTCTAPDFLQKHTESSAVSVRKSVEVGGSWKPGLDWFQNFKQEMEALREIPHRS